MIALLAGFGELPATAHNIPEKTAGQLAVLQIKGESNVFNTATRLLSFVLCFIFTPMCRDIAIRYNLVTSQMRPVSSTLHLLPRVGGLAIVLAYATALGVMLLVPPSNEQLHIQHHALLRVLLPPAALIFLLGLLDDLVTLSALQKLAGQVAACVTRSGAGTSLRP